MQPDTAHVPNSGPTVASRTCMIVGKLVESAALGLQQDFAGQRIAAATDMSAADFARACARTSQKIGAAEIFVPV